MSEPIPYRLDSRSVQAVHTSKTFQTQHGMITPMSSPKTALLDATSGSPSKSAVPMSDSVTLMQAPKHPASVLPLDLSTWREHTAIPCDGNPEARPAENPKQLKASSKNRITTTRKRDGKRKIGKAKPQTKSSLCATHPSMYTNATCAASDVDVRKMHTDCSSTVPEADKLCSPAKSPRPFHRSCLINYNSGTVTTPDGPPAWTDLVGFNNRDITHDGPYVLSPMFLIGLPLGGTLEMANRYE